MATYRIVQGSGSIGSGTYRGVWSNSQTWAVGDRVAPSVGYATAAARGYIYECTTGGAGGASEPTWVYTTPDTSTTTSSSAVFTCREIDDWTNAGVYFDQGVQRALTSGDEILVHYTHQEELAADTTYTFAADVNVYSVNKDSSDALTAMQTDGWIGNSTTNRSIVITSNDLKIFIHGLTLRISGTAGETIILAAGVGSQYRYESCYFWQGNTNSSGTNIQVSSSTSSSGGSFAEFFGCTFRFGNASQGITTNGEALYIYGGSISSAGAAPTTLFKAPNSELVCLIVLDGVDLSHVTGTLVGDSVNPIVLTASRCKLAAGVTPLAAQTGNPTRSSSSVKLLDCHSGDTHIFFGYYDALGQVTSDTGIYFTSGAAGQSWKIATTANCGFGGPFTTPWISLYNTGTSAITPYFEILRDGSATAYQNDEVWAEFSAKTTSGFVTATYYSDRMTPRGTPADQAAGAGTGSWTGEAGSAWSGKIDSGASFTPAEVGDIAGRIVVGEPSITVYVDPQIRT